MPGARMLADCCLDLGKYLSASELLALRPDTVQPGVDPAADDLPLRSIEHACRLGSLRGHSAGAVDE
jgi:hypothetical protein